MKQQEVKQEEQPLSPDAASETASDLTSCSSSSSSDSGSESHSSSSSDEDINEGIKEQDLDYQNSAYYAYAQAEAVCGVGPMPKHPPNTAMTWSQPQQTWAGSGIMNTTSLPRGVLMLAQQSPSITPQPTQYLNINTSIPPPPPVPPPPSSQPPQVVPHIIEHKKNLSAITFASLPPEQGNSSFVLFAAKQQENENGNASSDDDDDVMYDKDKHNETIGK